MGNFLDNVDEASEVLGVSRARIEQWKRGYYQIPYQCRYVIERMENGWRPKNIWLQDRDWLLKALQEKGQTVATLSNALKLSPATAHRYVLNNGGPKRYVMMAAEAWLDGQDLPVPVGLGRPVKISINESNAEFNRRLDTEPEFLATWQKLMDLLVREGGTPQQRASDMALVRQTMGY